MWYIGEKAKEILYLFDKIENDINLLKSINSLVGSNRVDNAGQMRKYDVNIGGTNWKPKIPDENNVNNQIESILNDNNKTITDKSLSIMCYLMRTQFFSDGNKRTSMLFANKILIENGKGIMIADGIIVVVDFEMPSNDTTNTYKGGKP